MQFKFVNDKMRYDGHQLRSLYSYMKYGMQGDSILSWIGPCNIPFEHMVDGEDLLQQAKIQGDEMLHFIFEIFDRDLFSAVALQRLFAAIIKDHLVNDLKVDLKGNLFYRDGDDLYWGNKKLSISIASRSPISVMIHFALNIVNSGTPVETCCLNDFAVEPKTFSDNVMKKFVSEYTSILLATRKVRGLI